MGMHLDKSVAGSWAQAKFGNLIHGIFYAHEPWLQISVRQDRMVFEPPRLALRFPVCHQILGNKQESQLPSNTKKNLAKIRHFQSFFPLRHFQQKYPAARGGIERFGELVWALHDNLRSPETVEPCNIFWS